MLFIARARLVAPALLFAVTAGGCGILDTVTPSTGGTFTAHISNTSGANNAKSDYSATTVAGSVAGVGTQQIFTLTTLATSLTATDTQSITLNLGFANGTKLAAGQTFTIGASQSGTAPWGVATYAETVGSDNSKTRGWKGETAGTAKIDSVDGKKVSLTISDVAMTSSAAPSTGTFTLRGSGTIDVVSGL